MLVTQKRPIKQQNAQYDYLAKRNAANSTSITQKNVKSQLLLAQPKRRQSRRESTNYSGQDHTPRD